MTRLNPPPLEGLRTPPESHNHKALANLNDLVQQARALGEVYHSTWDVSNLQKQIELYHAALDCFVERGPLSSGCVPARALIDKCPTATVYIQPLDGHYGLVFHLARQHVPKAFVKMLNTTIIELDCTLPEAPDQGEHAKPCNEASLAACCTELGIAYYEKYDHSGLAGDIALYLSYSTIALSLSPYYGGGQANALWNVGRALTARFRHEAEASLIDYSVQAHRQAIRLGSRHATHVDIFSVDLATSLREKYAVSGNRMDLTEATELLEHALSKQPPGYEHHTQVTVELSHCFYAQNRISDQLDDLYKGLTLVRESLAALSPKNPERYKPLWLLSIILKSLFNSTGNAEFLRECINRAEEVTNGCARGHFVRANSLTILSLALRSCSDLDTSEADLDKGVLLATECLEINPNHPTARASLAMVLGKRFQHSGDPDDLDASISLRRTQSAMQDPKDPTWATNLVNLACSLCRKSEHTLNTEHLDEAITLLRKASASITIGHTRRNVGLFNLASVLTTRFIRNQSVEDLREALCLHNSWLYSNQLAEPHKKSWFLLRVAEVRQTSFEYFGDPGDLNVAIDVLEQACQCLSDTARSPVHAPATIGRLGSCYGHRAILTGSDTDMSKALHLILEALDSPWMICFARCELMFDLANFYGVIRSPLYNANNALDTYTTAVTDTIFPAASRLVQGIKILYTLDDTLHTASAMDSRVLAKLLQAYHSTIQLLPQIAYFGLDPHLRLRALAQAPTLAANGAACAAREGNPESAMELLEEGRTVFWTQQLRLRTPLDGIPHGMAEKIRHTIHQLEFQSKRAGSESAAENEARLTHQRELSQTLAKLLEGVRLLPGLDRFLLPETSGSLARAAHRNPVLILIATQRFCGAILIRDPNSRPVQLQFDASLSSRHIQRLYDALHKLARESRGAVRGRAIKSESSKSAKSDGLFRDMWTMIMQPIVRGLGWSKAQGMSRPRLTICATGLFTHLPVHAASVSGEGTWNYFVCSYTPTLGVLLTAHRAYRPLARSSASLLLAAVPRPYQGAQLLSVDEEVSIIQKVLPTGQVLHIPCQSDPLRLTRASCEDVLTSLPQVNMLHLACHGHHNAKNMLESGFLMWDKMLTINNLMCLDLPNSLLAFLSACETAKNAEAQPDQAVHLAAAMLFAGFKSVIGTMWSMHDVDGPTIAKCVYEEIFSGDGAYLDPDRIPYALDAAVGKLRDRKVHPSRWAPYIHLGI